MEGWILIGVVLLVLFLVFKSLDKSGFYLRYIVVGTILFFLISFIFVAARSDISIDGFDGFFAVTEVYFSWFGNVVGNVGQITGNAIKMDWSADAPINQSLR